MKKQIVLLICWIMLGSAVKVNAQDNDVIYTIVENMPQFPGGEEGMKKYMIDNVKYPENSKENGVEGIVYVTFYVDLEGKVKDAKIIKGKDPFLDEEALRVVNAMPLWTPGTQSGKTVKVQYNLPIRFSLTVPDKKNKNK